MGKNLWSRPAPDLPVRGAKSAAVMEPLATEEVAAESSRQLEEKGWCLWECSGLGGEVIVVIISELITNYPKEYPVYTLQELKDILPLDDQMLQAAHRAKKELGAKIGEG